MSYNKNTLENKPGFGRREKPRSKPITIIPKKTIEPKCYLQRRLEPVRHIQLKRVKLIFNDGYGVYNAILRDISDNGAKIETVDALHLPDTFTMTTADGSINKICTRVWRTGHFIGVQFTP